MSLTLKTMLAFEDVFNPADTAYPFDRLFKQIQADEKGRMVARLRNGANVTFLDYTMPSWMCLPTGACEWLPSEIIFFLAKNQPTEDVEISFVGGTITRRKI